MSTTKASTQVKFTFGSPPAMGLLEGVTGQSGGPGGSKSASDISAINATVNLDRDGRPTYEPLSLTCTWDPTDPSAIALLAAIQSASPAAVACELGTTLGTTPGIQFSGYINSFGLKIPNEGPCEMTTGIAITSALTKAANTSVTPNNAYDPETGQGALFKWYVTNTFVTAIGVENVEFSGMSRVAVPATEMSAAAPTSLPGSRVRGNVSWDMLYDTAEARQVLMEAAYAASDQVDQIQILLPNSAKTVTCSVTVNGWNVLVGAKNAPNRVRVSARLTSDIVVA